MAEYDELREDLVKTLMNAASVDEKAKIGAVLNQYDSNANERRKNEQKSRLDQDIHEDDLRKERDQALIEDRRYRWEVTKDVTNIVLKVLGGLGTIMLISKAMKDDKDGTPWFGPLKEIASAFIRKWF